MKNKPKVIDGTPEIRPYGKSELATLYNVSLKVFRRWLQSNPDLQKDRHQKVFSIVEVEKIFQVLGRPHKVIVTEIKKAG